MSTANLLPATDALVALDRVSWATFAALASESCGGRLAYDRGRLEIMSPSLGHENVKSLVCRFIEIFAEEQGIDLVAAGSVTLARNDLDCGIEADACYFFGSHLRLQSRNTMDLSVDPPWQWRWICRGRRSTSSQSMHRSAWRSCGGPTAHRSTCSSSGMRAIVRPTTAGSCPGSQRRKLCSFSQTVRP